MRSTESVRWKEAMTGARGGSTNLKTRGRYRTGWTKSIPFLLLLAVVSASGVQRVLAQNAEQNIQRLQRNSYLDLWTTVFDALDLDAIDDEVTELENRVESSDGSATKHRLMDILEGRRKEKRSANLLKGLARQHSVGTVNPSHPGRVFGGGGGGMGAKVRQLGIPVENASFESKLCFKMQNLGNADKYHGVIAGSPTCDELDTAHSTSSSMITWKAESTFLIDCSITSVSQNATDGSMPSIRAALTKGSYGDGSLQAVSSRASCSLSVVSDTPARLDSGDDSSGATDSALHSHRPSAAMLKLVNLPLPTDHAIDVAPLNAIKIKLCDLSSSAWSVNSTDAVDTEDQGAGEQGPIPDVTLTSVKLNGKRLTSQELFAEKGEACKTHAYRVPTVGLSNEGFVLSGALLLRERRTLGAGRASGVEISFGSVSLIDTSFGDDNVGAPS